MALDNPIGFPNARFAQVTALVVLSLTALAFASSAPAIPAHAKDSPAASPNLQLSPQSARSLAPLVAGDEKWAPGSGVRGVNGTVEALAVDDGGNVYMGGRLNMAGNLPARNVAKWDGTNWSALAYGLDEQVISLAWDSVHRWLYAGGDFMNICLNADCSLKKPSRGIARWDPSGGGSWHALDYGLNGRVSALALDTIGNLYAGGSFPTICYSPDCSAGDPANNIAEWNPAGAGVWSALSSTGGIGVSGGEVYALAWWNAPLIGEVLVAGGGFTSTGGIAMNHLAYWTPATNTWSSFLSGVDGIVYALAVDWSTSSVVVGGSFLDICQIGAVPPACGTPTRVNNIALLALLAPVPYWGPLNNGVSGYVYTVSIDNLHKSVYVGGYVWGYCNQLNCGYGTYTPVPFLASFDYAVLPGSWTTLGKGTDDAVKALAWNQAAGLLYAGGFFKQAGDGPSSSVAKWDGNAWSSVGSGDGVGGFVNALAADANGRVYVGGTFRSIGTVFVNRIAVWNTKTNTWSALSYGVSGDVDAIALDASGNLYIGGKFIFLCANSQCSGPPGQQVNGIAKWTPNPSGTGTWSALGPGVYPGVQALAIDHNNKLYAGGNFSQKCDTLSCLSPVPANNVAVWNGSNWSNLGLGVNYTIRALTVDKDNNLYAGGDFYRLCTDQICQNGPTANHIARWAPTSGGGGTWSPVGNGVDRSVLGLVVDRNNILFAGGGFGFICSSPACTNNTQVASGIAKWNGSWSSVGNGLKGSVRVLGLDEWNQIFAGGFLDALCADPNCYGASTMVNNIARWDGATWNALGSGIGPMPGAYVNALSYSHGTLFVGGDFGTAGDKVSANFARYIYGKYIFVPQIVR